MKEKIITIIKDIAEIGLDKVLNDGLLKDIPIINTIHSLSNICHTISDKLLFNKIKKFLFELDSLSNEERIELFEKLEKEPKLKQKASIYILELFDKIDDENKATMIFKVFKAYSDGLIDYEMFYRLNRLIKEISSIDISDIREEVNQYDKQDSFYKLGFLRLENAFDGAVYNKTELFDKFIMLNLDEVYKKS